MINKVNFLSDISQLQKLLTAVLVIGLLLTTVSIVSAASWSKGLQGDCSSSQPKGDAWLNWSGYTSGSWGSTISQLDWWNGSGWTTYGYSESGRVYGASNTALAHSTAGYRSGLWSVGGLYSASFNPFNGSWQGPDWYNFSCQ